MQGEIGELRQDGRVMGRQVEGGNVDAVRPGMCWGRLQSERRLSEIVRALNRINTGSRPC